MPGEKSLAEDFAQILLRRIIDHLHLLDNYALLSFQIGRIKTRIREHIRDQVECLRHLIVNHFYSKARFLVCCKSIQIAAEAVLFDCDVQYSSFVRALKNRVLDEM